jgi:hypothetical protein
MNTAVLSFRAAFRAAQERLVALLLAVTVAAGLVGGGNGLSFAVVGPVLAGSLWLRLGLVSLLFLLALPSAQAALLSQDGVYLRALGLSRAPLAAGQALVLLLAGAPWTLLALSAARPGPLALAGGLAAPLALLGAHALALDLPLPGLLLAACSALHPLAAIAAAAASPLLLARAFSLAPAVPRPEHRPPARLSLWAALLRMLVRTRLEALVRALGLLWLALALVTLAARQQPQHRGAIVATAALLWTALGLGPLAAALQRLETRERWSLLFLGRGAFLRAQLALLLPAALLGPALIAAPLGPAFALRGAAAGLLWGGLVAASERDLELRGADAGGRVVRLALLLFFGCLVLWSREPA